MSVTLGQYITTPDEFGSIEQEEAWCAAVAAKTLNIIRRKEYPKGLRKSFPRFSTKEGMDQHRNDVWVHKFACWWEALPPSIARSLYREVIQP